MVVLRVQRLSVVPILVSACLLGLPVVCAGGVGLTLDTVATGLSSPVFATHAPGDFDRIFVVEQIGRIRIIENGTLVGAPFLDIDSQVGCCGEAGLLGLAFHPDFPSTPYFYVYYTNNSGHTTVSRFEVPPGTPNNADESSEQVLLTIDQIAGNHNGGWIGFSPNDGYLYIATGDGGGACDPEETGQDLSRLLGKILRIDIDSGLPYAIPATNPFASIAGEDEIWAYGLRNPWRCAFDAANGDFYMADVGQGQREEVDYQPFSSLGGENYGWDCKEGTECATISGCSAGLCNCLDPSFVDPVHEYTHGEGCSITGGEVYRGCAIPQLEGRYFFGDYCSGNIWSIRMENGSVAEFVDETIALGAFSLSGFGRDAYGEIYICDLGGTVHKIVPTVENGIDCNSNGVSDACDLADGTATDADGNGIPDVCQAVPTLSLWGFVALALLMLATGSVVFGRNRVATG